MADEFGPYILDHVIAQGGMGTVYLATDPRLDRRVALKLLGEQWIDRPDSRERFGREWRLAASLDHPHILPVYDAGEIEGRPYLAMRYVDGATLADLLRSDGPFEPDRAAAIVAQVASALDAAHGAGLVHRDVKPANVLVTETSTGEHAYLSDFGVSRTIDNAVGMTRAGELVGTVDYIAPEQIEGAPVDPRVDVYSLACVLFELLTGVPPFRRDTPVASLFAHVQAPRLSVAQLRPGTPQALDDVIRRGMAVRPDDRYATAGELARAAQMALDGATLLADSHDADSLRRDTAQDQPTVIMATGLPAARPPAQPITAPPPPPVPRAAGQTRNLRTPLILTAMAALVVLAGLVALRALAPDPQTATAGTAAPSEAAPDVDGAGAAVTCDQQQVAAPAGKWRLWRTEYGRRGNGDYLRLLLRHEGNSDQAAAATVAVVPRDDVAAGYGVNPPGDAPRALVVAFNGPVSIGGGWGASPRYGALKEFRIERGSEGRVVAVAAISDGACYTLSGEDWTKLTLEIQDRAATRP